MGQPWQCSPCPHLQGLPLALPLRSPWPSGEVSLDLAFKVSLGLVFRVSLTFKISLGFTFKVFLAFRVSLGLTFRVSLTFRAFGSRCSVEPPCGMWGGPTFMT